MLQMKCECIRSTWQRIDRKSYFTADENGWQITAGAEYAISPDFAIHTKSSWLRLHAHSYGIRSDRLCPVEMECVSAGKLFRLENVVVIRNQTSNSL